MKNQSVFPAAALARHRLTTDGSGVTTLVVAHGCPLACKYCINPYTLAPETRVRRYTPAQLYEEVKMDHLYFLATGGGVVFGGGEPLLYAEFIRDFRAVAPPEWKFGVETSLNVPEQNLRTTAASVDYFIVDVKDMDDAVYQRYTGQSPQRMKANLPLLLALAGAERVKVRVPLIRGYNTPAGQRASAEALTEMGFAHIETFSYRVP